MLKEYPNHTPALAETVGVTALARPAKKRPRPPAEGTMPRTMRLGTHASPQYPPPVWPAALSWLQSLCIAAGTDPPEPLPRLAIYSGPWLMPRLPCHLRPPVGQGLQ